MNLIRNNRIKPRFLRFCVFAFIGGRLVFERGHFNAGSITWFAVTTGVAVPATALGAIACA